MPAICIDVQYSRKPQYVFLYCMKRSLHNSRSIELFTRAHWSQSHNNNGFFKLLEALLQILAFHTHVSWSRSATRRGDKPRNSSRPRYLFFVPRHGRPQKFFRDGAKSTFRLSFSACWRCNANGLAQNASPFLHHKENAQYYGNSCIQCYRSKKI